MIIIDTHTHLYLEDFKNDIDEVFQRARTYGVKKFYLPAIDSEVIDDLFELEKKYPDECFAMMGLHPCSVKENYQDELHIVKQWLDKRKFIAVGEIGLDFYWDTTFSKQQYDAFEIQMQWALNVKLPIVIHSRNAMNETIQTLQPYAAKGLKGVFHCFSGTYEQAKEIIEMGFYLGIGGVVTYKKAGLDSVIEKLPVEHLVVETDAPYLTPVPFRGKRNESCYLKYVIEKIAQIKNITVEDVAAITTANVEKIFGS